jgi:PAS domain S-box-containing protein
MAKILIVDDRVLNRQFLLTLLGYSGHQLLEAADGAEALEKVRAERPDLVITDLLMPTMDGFQLVQQMRADPDIARISVIFYTATYRLEEAKSLADACGVSVVIAKPSEPSLILDAVNAVLQKQDLPRADIAAVVAAETIVPQGQLRGRLTDSVLNFQLLNAQMTELVEHGSDPAARECAVLDVSVRLRQAMTDLQAVSLKLASLLELGLELSTHRDPNRLLEVFCRAAMDVLGAKYGALAILHDDGESFAYFKCHAQSKENMEDKMMPPTPRAGILGSLLDEPRTRRLRNPGGDPESLGLSPSHPPIQNFLGVPIASSQQVYGWFYLVDTMNDDDFSESDEQLAATLAAQLAAVYQAVQLYDEVQRHAAKLELEVFRRKQAEEKFYSAIHAAPNGMLMVDGEGKIELVNSKIVEMFGYQSSELIGQPIEMLVPERLRHKHIEHRAGFTLNLQTRSMGTRRELYGRRKDGSDVAVEIGLNPLATNEGSMVIASVIDITERKKAELTMRERMRVAEFSAEISGALATEGDLRGVLQKCAEAAVHHLEATFARIWTLNERENILELQASAGMYTHIDGSHGRVPVGQFRIGLIAQERRPHLTNAVVGDPRVSDQEWAKREGMVGFAGYPLLVDGRLVGVIAMFSRQPIPATIFEVMASGANQIGVGIERKLAEERARAHFNRIRALHEIDVAISSTLDLRAVLNVLLERIEPFLPIAAATTVRLLNDATGELESLACRGIEENEWRLLQRTVPGGRANRIVETRAALTVRNIIDDRDTYNSDIFRKHGLVSYLGVPLIAKEKVLGVLSLYTDHEHEFSQEESEFLDTLAGQAAIAIHNAQLHEQTTKQHLALIEQERIQRILKELSQDITKMDVDTLLEKLTSTIRAVFKVDISDVRFLAGGKWANIFVATENLVQRLPDGGEFRLGATDWVLKNRKSIAIHDYLEQKEFTPGRVTNMFGVRGFLAAPLLSKSGEVMGVIRALSKEPRTFTPQEIDLFEQLANGAAVAIENERLYVDLEKSDKIKSEFLGVMSHELRTPLNIIMGYAAFFKDDLVDEADHDNRNSVVTIETQANELLTMFGSIMQATQIESGATPVHKHQVDIGRLMLELKALYDAPLDKNLALVWKYPQSLPSLVTDDGILTRILQKLIDNAIKFTKSGTVTISARVNGSFEFQVSDTGVGIPTESLSVIFDIFKQVDSSSTREFGGAGLGLYIAKKFTELLGGSIDVESVAGQGSTFTIKIPCQWHDTQQIHF